MKTHYTLSVVLLGLATALSTRAQSPMVSNANGLLGQRYVEASVGAIDPHGSSDYGFSGDVSVNLPVQTGLDVGFGYTYNRLNADLLSGLFKLRQRDHTLSSTLTGYSTFGNIKPFAGLGVGYQWSRAKLNFGGTRVFETDDDDAVWGAGIGAEIPVGAFTITPSISYQDTFSSDSSGAFAYGVEGHTWFTRTLGGFGEVTFSDPTGGGRQAWIYRAGVRLRF
jgi:opacity protein-like surface antigen